jgi:hypothetical protein
MGFQPMYHRQDADATKSDAHGLFRIRITAQDETDSIPSDTWKEEK